MTTGFQKEKKKTMRNPKKKKDNEKSKNLGDTTEFEAVIIWTKERELHLTLNRRNLSRSGP